MRAFLTGLYRRITADRIVAIAAGVTFYALLAIFPAIAALVSIYGIFADAGTIEHTISLMSGFLPGGAIEVVGEQIRRVAANSHRALGLAAVGGILVAIWSANSGVKAMFEALNVALEQEEKRSFVRLNAVSLAFTAGTILAVLLGIAAIVAVPAVLGGVGSGMLKQVLDYGRWPILWVLILVGIALLYRFGPSRNDIPRRWISWGSVFASLAWLGASIAFSWYAANFGTYNKTYGSLGAVVGFMIWIWITAIIVLLGEELNEALDKGRDRKKPPRAAAHTVS